MAFGQQSGPPASARQVQELVQLLREAGHVDFRDARGPMGFTQRQAGGKFTRDEADAFISRLQEDAPAPDPAPAPARPTDRDRPPRPTPPVRSLVRVPDDQLAAELRRRGWTVTGP